MDDIQIRMLQLGTAGYNCSQILLQLALETRAEENPALVRAMAGLAYGCGEGRATCGVLTGGCCLLALYAGQGRQGENPSDRLPLMLAELSAWFGQQVGLPQAEAICSAITGEDGPAASRQRCAGLVADTFAKCMQILTAHGFDPTEAN